MELKGKNIAILGIGIEGISSALYLQQKGAIVTVLDQKDEAKIDNEILSTLRSQKIPYLFKPDAFADLTGFDLVVRSPGIKRFSKELIVAQEKGIVITSQTKLFFDLCPCPIIGVTGTKGKGTTSTLIYEMLKKQGFSTYLGGNIGKPPFSFLDTLTPQSKVVLEMSSFQLQDLTKSPHIGVILMMTSEHLDYHQDVYEYVDAKRNIIRFQANTDFAVINRDYIASNESDIYTEGKVFYVSREREVTEGCFVREKKVMLRVPRLAQVSQGEKITRGTRDTSDTRDTLVIDINDILLPGGHNLENVCAAVMAAGLAGVTKASMVSVLTTFKGLEHRIELVGEVNGVRFYDDSFSTTPETAIAAIEAFQEPKVLILGGSSKNSDFTQLGQIISVSKSIRAIIGIGVEWSRIKEKIQDSRFKIYEGCKNMQEIVQTVSKVAEPGDVVLLSPACASFDMFKNYKERGEQFKREVGKLSEDEK